MRFVSQYTNFVLNIRNPKKKFTEYGVDVVEDEIVAEFDPRSWNQRDLETAIASFRFKGLFQHEDEATPVHPAYRISVYDTDEMAMREGWDEETKAFVEQRLLTGQNFGRNYVAVTELALDPPWPSYDQFEGKPQELVEQVLALGFDLEEVATYESSKWGQQRDEVLAALQAATEARDSGQIVIT
jgi:hypothetical protein